MGVCMDGAIPEGVPDGVPKGLQMVSQMGVHEGMTVVTSRLQLLPTR